MKRKEDECRKLREHNDELQDTLESLSKMANEMAGGRGQSQSPSRNSGGVVETSIALYSLFFIFFFGFFGSRILYIYRVFTFLDV